MILPKPKAPTFNKQAAQPAAGEQSVSKVVEQPQPVKEASAMETLPTQERQPEPTKPAAKPLPANCEAYRPIVAKYKWNVNVAMSVMRAESGCNPYAANWTDNHKVCKGSFGLFQISCHSGQVYDPEENIRIAYQKYQARGWQPWSATTCKYKVKCY